MSPKYVYFFGGGKADGRGEMKNLLGGKGANLAEMTNLAIPVPAGFTITTDVCRHYLDRKRRYPAQLKTAVKKALARVEKLMEARFGDPERPLLVSVRSGSRQSMPGMMETVLNVGLTEKTLPGIVALTGNERFAYDSYRRLITMYSDVVMEKAEGIEPKPGRGVREQLEGLLDAMKRLRGASQDTDLSASDLQELCGQYKAKVLETLGSAFPDDPMQQLWGGIGAVFASWNGKRAISYRRIESIPYEWCTAVNVQSMVFGNMGEGSSTGVAFTRDPASGENVFYGEYLPDAQGEDVVAGIRTPLPINVAGKTDLTRETDSLEQVSPSSYAELEKIRKRLERHYRDMMDIEFTIQEGKLWMLQCRVGKRTGTAAIRIAVEMAGERLIGQAEAVLRVEPEQLDELLHPTVDPAAEAAATVIVRGLAAGPGGATGQIVFSADDAEEWALGQGRKVILVRNETSPEDIHGMHVAEAILTAKGGVTSHAALVARGWGKCCIVGCSALKIDYAAKSMQADGRVLREGDVVTLNGTRGFVYEGELPLKAVDLSGNEPYRKLMSWADRFRRLKVRANADSPEDSRQAIEFGAEGIGLCRTEHMFFDDERIRAMRELIVAGEQEQRRRAIMKLLPFQREDFRGILEAMAGKPVTIRLLDPPLHEFLPTERAQIEELARDLDTTSSDLEARIAQLHELNPMLGHRGCRLGITFPEITEMQARAIFEAAAELTARGIKVYPEVMIPLVGTRAEFLHQSAIVRRMANEVRAERKVKFPYWVGTMIELPRAALAAGEIAREAEFFSFGTNDLTQTTFGFSRDDIGTFLPLYLEEKILPADPFMTIDQAGVGELLKIGVERGRAARPGLKIGICGEHGGDPKSVKFFHDAGLDYVSCSPFRVPIARLAAAHAALAEKERRPSPSKPKKKSRVRTPNKKKASKKKTGAKKAAKKQAGRKKKSKAKGRRKASRT